MPSSAEFKLSITKALGHQLVDSISGLTPAPLNDTEIATLRPEQGVYQLYHDGELVYIGKADDTLPARLGQHRRKISGRQSIELGDMTFTALYVEEDLSAVAPETLLINHHRTRGAISWNFGGFGRNDPGRERDTTRLKPTDFDARFPIQLDWPCDTLQGDHTAIELLRHVKTYLPYVFRYQDAQKRDVHQPPDYHQTNVHVVANTTADDLLRTIVEALPAGWQITALHGYVIMYHETRNYTAALRTYRR
jgi:hypothetical protein